MGIVFQTMPDLPLPLLKFQPVLLEKPWGGNKLWSLLGKGDPGDTRMGESWELSDRREAESIVSEGPLRGASLVELLALHGERLLGAGAGFPLLYKFICAREKLSVQVHPGAGSSLGEAKTECWYVVDAEPGAELIVGVSAHGGSRDEILSLLKSSRCGEVLRRWPARKGDVFFIPAGTVHAISEGLLLYEVQQNSDTTFRLYDWGRVDAQGRPRALHLEEASRVADLEEREGFKIPPLRMEHASHSGDYLVACPYFALLKWHGFRAPALLETRGKFRVLSVVAGAFEAVAESGVRTRLKLGDTALVPASLRSVRLEAASAESELLVSFVPDPERDLLSPLRRAGYSDEAIARLSGPSGIKV